MDIKAANALNAYTDALKRAVDASGGGDQGLPAAGGQGLSFSEMVTEALEGAVKIERTGEHTAMQSVAAKADLVDVVTAVTNAEVALQAVVAVRDRVIAADQEIIRMPI